MFDKLNPACIFLDHINTLSEYSDRHDTWRYLALTYLAPFAAGLIAEYFNFSLKSADYATLIGILGIFAGLLLNLQVGLFAIYVRTRPTSPDPLMQEIRDRNYVSRNAALREISANLSYMTLICVISLAIVFAISIPGPLPNISGFWAVSIALHLVTTLLLVIKGAHILFRDEYLTN